MNILLLCLVTFIGCVAYSIHFNIRGRYLFVAALGSSLTYFAYYISDPLGPETVKAFLASLVASIFAETLARIMKVPATTFLIISIIPLVPGSNLYYSMELCISGEIMPFLSSALETLGIAGAIALGILLVSSIFRFIRVIRQVASRQHLPFPSKKKNHN